MSLIPKKIFLIKEKKIQFPNIGDFNPWAKIFNNHNYSESSVNATRIYAEILKLYN